MRRWFGGWRGDPEVRELIGLIRGARKDIRGDMHIYEGSRGSQRTAQRAMARLEELEREVREGSVDASSFRDAEAAIVWLMPKGARRPDAPSPRTSGLIQLRNRLVELARPTGGGRDG